MARAPIQAQAEQTNEPTAERVLKRKPTLNEKIQIRDKVTGRVYISQNNA